MPLLTDWPQLSVEERGVLLDDLLERIPSWLELVDARGLAPTFRARAGGATWRLFTGGPFERGASVARREAIEAVLTRFPERLSPLAQHRPGRWVDVAPFLMAERVLEVGLDEPQVLFRNYESEARGLLSPFGARIPRELEWEFAWDIVRVERGGWVPASNELCADGWSLEASDDFIPGGPAVVRTADFDLDSFAWILPTRAPLKGARVASVRPTLDLPR